MEETHGFLDRYELLIAKSTVPALKARTDHRQGLHYGRETSVLLLDWHIYSTDMPNVYSLHNCLLRVRYKEESSFYNPLKRISLSESQESSTLHFRCLHGRYYKDNYRLLEKWLSYYRVCNAFYL